MYTSLAVLYLGVAVFALYRVALLLTQKPRPPLPPGPKGLPFIGNINALPPKGAREWEHWIKHKDLYGPISSVPALGTTLIIINDEKAAVELLDKRGSMYSSRPLMPFSDMCGWKHNLASMRYGKFLKASRQKIHKAIGSNVTLARFIPLQDIEAHRFLLRVLQEPESWIQHLKTEAAAIILKLSYGYNVEPHGKDLFVDLADRATWYFSKASVPGAWIVDVIPWLRYLPNMPGIAFQKFAKASREIIEETAGKPLEFVKRQMKTEKYKPSFTSAQYENVGGVMTEEDELVTKWSALGIYLGGADTVFFLAMLKYPEVQRKAQEEIDRVVGTDRLPNIEDRANLPYIDAVMSEALRWHPVVPMAVPHVPNEDDVYEGYFIPKGSLVIPNVWHFTHNPEVYHDPMAFNPDRFLTEKPAPDPRNFIFGYGRRICPGRFLAESSTWLTIAKSLAALDTRRPVINGKEFEPPALFEGGIISHATPFKATIKPRSAKYERLIRSVEDEHPWEKSDAQSLHDIVI